MGLMENANPANVVHLNFCQWRQDGLTRLKKLSFAGFSLQCLKLVGKLGPPYQLPIKFNYIATGRGPPFQLPVATGRSGDSM